LAVTIRQPFAASFAQLVAVCFLREDNGKFRRKQTRSFLHSLLSFWQRYRVYYENSHQTILDVTQPISTAAAVAGIAVSRGDFGPHHFAPAESTNYAALY
jgi:hypothetical protein